MGVYGYDGGGPRDGRGVEAGGHGKKSFQRKPPLNHPT